MFRHRDKEYKSFSKFAITLIDLVILHGSFLIAFMIKFGFNIPKENYMPYIVSVPIITIAFIFLFNIYGLYTITAKVISDIVFSLFISLLLLSLITISSTFITRYFAFPRSVLLMALIIQFIAFIPWRIYVQAVYKKIHGVKNVLILCEGNTAEAIARKIILSARGWYNVKFIVNPEKYEQAFKLFDEIDTIYIQDIIDENIKGKIIIEAVKHKKDVNIIPEFSDILLTNLKIGHIDDVPVINIGYPELTNEQKFMKRVFDIVMSLSAVIIAAPVMAVVWVLIKLTSQGPAIYKQIRVTENNREFNIYKFRTMYDNSEESSGPVLASDNDTRITKLGKVLRGTRLDELPQLFNVLRGEMSFVGPRPERPFFVKKFEEEEPTYCYRHNVKAGITGYAQVIGKYSTNFKDKLRLDLIYIKNYSLLLDLNIILLTIKIVFKKGASSGLKEQEAFDEFLKSMDYNVYKEAGVTILDK